MTSPMYIRSQGVNKRILNLLYARLALGRLLMYSLSNLDGLKTCRNSRELSL